ncbi:MAG: PAS domain-containing protein [Ilumatobacteraceae bacterium]
MNQDVLHDRRHDDDRRAPGISWSVVLNRTTEAILLSDTDGTIVYVNETLLDLFGYEPGDLVGQPIDVLIREVDDLDAEGRRADSTLFPIDLQQNSLPNSTILVSTVRDMTALRQSSVDGAIARIDLALARTRIDQLQESLDLVIQQLFALGTSIMASASDETALADRLEKAVRGIDEVIDAVQDRRRASHS